FFDAISEVEKEDAEVPNQLRDSSRDAEGFGHGEGYIYPHAYRDHWAAQQYLPTALAGRIFYTPSNVGFEKNIRDEVLRKREIQAAVILEESRNNDSAADSEILSWSAAAKGREGWFKRMESGRSALLLADRDLILDQNKINRHDRVLVAAAGDGLLLWESLRRCPEGLAACLAGSEEACDALRRFTAVQDNLFDDEDKPMIAVCPDGSLITPAQADQYFSCCVFDHILAREPWRRMAGKKPAETFAAFAASAKKLLAPEGNIVLLQSIPKLGERISRVLRAECSAECGAEYEAAPGAQSGSSVPLTLAGELASAEEEFFNAEFFKNEHNNGKAGRSEDSAAAIRWDSDTLEKCFIEQGFITETSIIDRQEERLITGRDLDNWFNAGRSAWGSFISNKLGPQSFNAIKTLLNERITAGPILWKWKAVLLKAKPAADC
ncbi:MAG: recombinase RarA, partial [Treponema sp.]|nr:recombinase RarA [Treponema sp.]